MFSNTEYWMPGVFCLYGGVVTNMDFVLEICGTFEHGSKNA